MKSRLLLRRNGAEVTGEGIKLLCQIRHEMVPTTPKRMAVRFLNKLGHLSMHGTSLATLSMRWHPAALEILSHIKKTPRLTTSTSPEGISVNTIASSAKFSFSS